MCQIVEGLQATGVPVLAFASTVLSQFRRRFCWGKNSVFAGESPAFVLSAAFAGQPVVLAVDDSIVSTTQDGTRTSLIPWRGYAPRCSAYDCGKLFTSSSPAANSTLSTIIGSSSLRPKTSHPLNLGNSHPMRSNRSPAGRWRFFKVNASAAGDAVSAAEPIAIRRFRSCAVENNFSTPKELCDAYWAEKKRKAVNAQRPEFAQHWLPVIHCLASTMSDRQELSVPANTMEHFPGVSRSHGLGRCAHLGRKPLRLRTRTFFDYCFARTQPNGGRDFVRFLEGDTQHLFRRAQLRQVLAFLRDDDFPRYLASLEELLRSERIRPHLKLLAVDLAAHPEAQG